MDHYLDKGEVTLSPKDVFWGFSLEKWLDDALLTRGTGGGAGATVPTSISLKSPDGSTWQVSVNNAGALVTTKI